jgi:hypothetical protein
MSALSIVGVFIAAVVVAFVVVTASTRSSQQSDNNGNRSLSEWKRRRAHSNRSLCSSCVFPPDQRPDSFGRPRGMSHQEHRCPFCLPYPRILDERHHSLLYLLTSVCVFSGDAK